jgi:hypothetical protein
VPTSAPSAASSAAASATPFEIGQVDQSVVAEYQAEGATVSEAYFLALTRGETIQRGPHEFVINMTFPTANTAQWTVTVTPDQNADPEGEASVALSHTASDAEWHFTLTYFVPYEDLPSDVVDDIRSGSTASVGVVLARAATYPQVQPVAAAKDGAQVIVDGLIKKWAKDRVKDFIKLLDEKAGLPVKGEGLYKQLTALASVEDALALDREFEDFDYRLRQLEQCVMNPTNPITKKTYHDHPEDQRALLDKIAKARTEIKENTAVSFLNLLVKTGSGLIAKAPAWLSWVVGPVSSWSKNALTEVSEKLIRDVDKEVVPCDSYQFKFSGSATAYDLGQPVTINWSYWGLKCSNTDEWQIWEVFDGIQQNSSTGPPENAVYGPIRATFDENGQIATSTWDPLGSLLFDARLGGTLQGTVHFVLSPPDQPDELQVSIIGEGSGPPISFSEAVDLRDGSFGHCPEDG